MGHTMEWVLRGINTKKLEFYLKCLIINRKMCLDMLRVDLRIWSITKKTVLVTGRNGTVASSTATAWKSLSRVTIRLKYFRVSVNLLSSISRICKTSV